MTNHNLNHLTLQMIKLVNHRANNYSGKLKYRTQTPPSKKCGYKLKKKKNFKNFKNFWIWMITQAKKVSKQYRIKPIVLQINQSTMSILELLNLNLPTKIKTKAILMRQSNILKLHLLTKANLQQIFKIMSNC